MIIDGDLMFSDKQDVSATGYSSNTVEIHPNLSPAGLDMAVQIVVRSASSEAATLTVELETSSDNTAWAKVAGVAKPSGEAVFSLSLNNVAGLRKYLRLRYVVSGAFNIMSMLVAGSGFSSAARVGNLPARGQE
ncbi:Bbp16 family capsid cement protein [Magnetospirillum aberrantis]|uniref:Discoidin domain-containing protein n=1 Tax=Magnetospirillum aberrantis SpK TaxID=908842 RepID=A0A7C9V1F8_9PROT|nr:hypothetical protein [Magnetospirillum aberrantis]NFV82115.1 hypothetical protein [Magnetospirillum aberrantis SpK]